MGKTSEKYSDAVMDREYAEKKEYTAFFRRYYPVLLFYATRFLDRAQAEDVVQDAFLDLWDRRSKIDRGDKIVTFMYRSVYTKALNKIKHGTVVNNFNQISQELHRNREAFYSPDNNDVIRLIENKELGREVNSVIDTLPQKCREVFRLSHIHGLKNKEIADTLGISIKTVEAHMYKALKLLRNGLSHL